MVILVIYLTGVWLAFILLLLLSVYYVNYAETKGIRLEQLMLPCLLSWVIVLLVLFVYWDKYVFLVKHAFNKIFKRGR
jgi:hypothetical protein